MDEHDDQVIDLASYVRRKQGEEEDEDDAHAVFSFWGGEGERTRFALPLWRAAYLAAGFRAALVCQRAGEAHAGAQVEPHVVLDLREDPARLDFTPACLAGLEDADAPGAYTSSREAVAIYLGEGEDRRWYMVVDDREGPDGEVPPRTRGDLLFLAGESAGLLFYRKLAVTTDGGGGDDSSA